MPTKSILVHLADDPHHVRRLKLAAKLATRFGAHLNILFSMGPIDLPAGVMGRGASMAFIEGVREEIRAHAEKVRDEAETVCSELSTWEWTESDQDPEVVIARWAHLADLLIVEQASHHETEIQIERAMSTQLLASAGCLTLIVPGGWGEEVAGERILIAWKNSRQAITAVRGAMSFLQAAKQVLIIASSGELEADPPGSDLVAYLGYHGIDSEVCETTDKGGTAILEAAERFGCDAIVMGAKASGALRSFSFSSFTFGGTTEHMMRHATVPLLMRF